MNRASQEKAAGLDKTFFADLAGKSDARFIYESIDAANSLLGTLNTYIDPEKGLRYMPIKYLLYTIYASVFLYKVFSTSYYPTYSLTVN